MSERLEALSTPALLGKQKEKDLKSDKKKRRGEIAQIKKYTHGLRLVVWWAFVDATQA